MFCASAFRGRTLRQQHAACAACLLLCFGTASTAFAQFGWVKRYVQRIADDTSGFDKPSFVVYPTGGYAPETSFEVGFAASLFFTARSDTATTRYSNLYAFVFYTFENQFGLIANNEIFSHRERWLLLGQWRAQSFPFLYYGIGPNARVEDETQVDTRSIQLRQRVLHKISGNWFGGLSADFNTLLAVEFEDGFFRERLPAGADGSTVLGLGPSLLYEGRHNPQNPDDGYLAELSWQVYDRAWGSQRNFQQYLADIRAYWPVMQRRDVLAVQAQLIAQSGDPAFNQLALLGGDMLMRGYYQGRFRDRNLLAGQVEYRLRPRHWSGRFGATVFASLGGVADEVDELALQRAVWAAGGGLRFLIFPRKNINIRFDVGVTREGLNFYIFTGEAF